MTEDQQQICFVGVIGGAQLTRLPDLAEDYIAATRRLISEDALTARWLKNPPIDPSAWEFMDSEGQNLTFVTRTRVSGGGTAGGGVFQFGNISNAMGFYKGLIASAPGPLFWKSIGLPSSYVPNASEFQVILSYLLDDVVGVVEGLGLDRETAHTVISALEQWGDVMASIPFSDDPGEQLVEAASLARRAQEAAGTAAGTIGNAILGVSRNPTVAAAIGGSVVVFLAGRI